MRSLSGMYAQAYLCRLFEVPRSTVRYVLTPSVQKDLLALKATIQVELLRCRGYGCGRMFKHLKRIGLQTSRNDVRQAYLEMGLLKRVRRLRARTTDSRHDEPRYPNLLKGTVVNFPDLIWSGDVTYLRVEHRFAYLALLMDIFTREILGFHVSFGYGPDTTLAALNMALATGRSPLIHHSDQGAHYAAKLYVRELQIRGVQLSMAAVGKPKENPFSERLNRTIKEEEIWLSEYQDLNQAQEGISSFVERYNNERLHMSLKNLTPKEVWNLWNQQKGGESSP